MDTVSQFYLSFLTLGHIVLIWTFDFLLPFLGLEPYVVHSQPWSDPVLPEHRTRVGPLYLSVAAGPLLLPSSLLPWPRTHSNVLPLHRQDGETSHRLWPVFTLLFRAFPWLKSDTKATFLPDHRYQQKHTGKCDCRSQKVPPIISFLSFSGVGFPAGLLWLRGVLLHPAGEEPGDPAAHGLPTQPHYSQYDCGKYSCSFLIFLLALPHSLSRKCFHL